MRDRESQTGSLLVSFEREKWLEDMFQGFLGHAAAIVRDDERDLIPLVLE